MNTYHILEIGIASLEINWGIYLKSLELCSELIQ